MRRRLVLIAALVVLAAAPEAWACPGCKEALFDPEQLPQRLATARGYALSIGLLLTVPFVLVAGLAALLFRAAQRTKRPVRSSVDTLPLSR